MSALEDIVRQIALQSTTSDITVRADIIREFIYKGAAILTDAKMLAPEVPYDNLDIKVEFPSDITIDYPVAEGAEGKEGRITWTPFNFSLEKAEGQFRITDEAVIRGYQQEQWRTGVRRLAEAFAKAKNTNILSTIAAGYTTTVATQGAWDGSTPKIVEDITRAVNTLIETDAARATLEDVKKMIVALPVKAFNLAGQLTTINNLKTSYKDYVESQYGLKLVPFRELSTSTGIGGGDDMLVVLPGESTAKHGVYRGGKVPLVEEKRVGSSRKYLVRQYFATKIVPDSSSVTTSSRIHRTTAILGSP
jgi:hypothetical protein